MTVTPSTPNPCLQALHSPPPRRPTPITALHSHPSRLPAPPVSPDFPSPPPPPSCLTACHLNPTSKKSSDKSSFFGDLWIRQLKIYCICMYMICLSHTNNQLSFSALIDFYGCRSFLNLLALNLDRQQHMGHSPAPFQPRPTFCCWPGLRRSVPELRIKRKDGGWEAPWQTVSVSANFWNCFWLQPPLPLLPLPFPYICTLSL